MPNYYFGGINAAGKSTFLQSLKEQEGDWEVVHGSQALMQWLGIESGDYQSLRRLPRAETNQAYGDLVRHRITENSGRKSLVFDSHYLNLVAGEVHKTVEGDWLSHVDALVLLAAHPDTIRDRIRRDADRDRRLFPAGASTSEQVDILDDYIGQTTGELNALAARFSLPSAIVYNEDGGLHGAVAQFNQFDQSVRTSGTA